MEPIGLQFKNRQENPFTGRISGELVIVHRCLHCGKIDTNRIAGDDTPYVVMGLLGNSDGQAYQGIECLTQDDTEEIRTALYGNNRM